MGVAKLALAALVSAAALVPRASSAGRGAALSGAGGEAAAPGGHAPLLSASEWDALLGAEPEGALLVVEFFAPWCPTCRRFAPEYAKAAAALRAASREALPRPVSALAVDCVAEAALCRRFSIDAYPTLLVGDVPSFHHGRDAVERAAVAELSAAGVLGFVEMKLGLAAGSIDASAGDAAEAAHQVEVQVAAQEEDEDDGAHAGPAVPFSRGSAVDVRDVVAATATAFENAASARALTGANRHAYVAFARMLAANHPAESCKDGARALVAELDAAWPADGSEAPAMVYAWDVCRAGPLGERPWHACRGSTPHTRGYTCGLWGLLHATAANAGGAPDAGKVWLDAVRGFVSAFFQCAACRRHFLEIASRPEAHRVASAHDAQLWLWHAHNEVNERLAAEEREKGGGDPKYPKVQWPPPHVCAPCRRADGSWDTREVLHFLGAHYRPPKPVPRARQPPWGVLGATASVLAVLVLWFVLSRGGSRRNKAVSTLLPLTARAPKDL